MSRCEPSSGVAADVRRWELLSLCQSASSLSMPAEQMRQLLNEGAARAGRTAAGEAPDRQPQPDRLAADRQIGGLSVVTAMDGGAERAASGTAGGIATRFGGDQEGVGTVAHHTKDAAAGKMAEQGHALICEPMPLQARDRLPRPNPPNSAKSHPRGPINFGPLLPLLLPGRPKRPARADRYRAKYLQLLVSALGLEPRTY